MNLDTSASRLATWFQDPCIHPNIKIELLLTNDLSVLIKQFS